VFIRRVVELRVTTVVMDDHETAQVPAVADWTWLSRVASARTVVFLGITGHLLAGLTYLAVHGQHGGPPAHALFETGILLGIPAALFGLVWFVERYGPRDADYWRLVAWAVSGTAGVFVITVVYFAALYFDGVTLSNPEFLVLLTADIGGLFGGVAGAQEIRVRDSVRRAQRAETRAELSEDHQQSLHFLNVMLRHHVLNGLSVILGRTETLAADARGDQAAALRAISERGEEMVDYVDDINTAVTALSGDIGTAEVNLSRVVLTECASARDAYPRASVETTVPEGVSVVGTQHLGRVFEHLLENAVEHNDAERPRVTVRLREGEAAARVTVADDGPGMSDAEKLAYFGRGEHGASSLGEGIGLYFAESVIAQCDGRIWIEDNDPTGTSVQIELPTVTS
jgi:signal transduction histidine kinase